MSPSAFNHTLGILRKILDFGIRAGARYNNPASGILRESERGKKLILPDNEAFREFIKVIENGGSRHSQPCADLVRFLAFGGFRKTEAAYVTWGDCDFSGQGMITIRGHPVTGLKNRSVGEFRQVPMISQMKELLGRIKKERPNEPSDKPVMLVHECQKAMNRAAEIVGIARITHHDLRHLFATKCIESGVDIPTVAKWLGHKDGGALAMKTYGHLRNEHSRAMAEKVKF